MTTPTLAEFCAARTRPEPQPELNIPTLQEAARHVLGHYGRPGGYRAGAFTESLIRCWELADNDNQLRLNSQWPELGAAIYLHRDGIPARLLNVAEGRHPDVNN